MSYVLQDGLVECLLLSIYRFLLGHLYRTRPALPLNEARATWGTFAKYCAHQRHETTHASFFANLSTGRPNQLVGWLVLM
ncbi:hypothetical protein BN1723_010255 [Verticillium longisporum]|uniref:Uncharacterized protein n=1 Tax=Verticillium longisporum TaxID=100787 RepID=A0A0G4KWL5_VERLO|nr:hypothetical protein BN1723_010255 [Verticillium longisporum]